jgi:hypothetical protein
LKNDIFLLTRIWCIFLPASNQLVIIVTSIWPAGHNSDHYIMCYILEPTGHSLDLIITW